MKLPAFDPGYYWQAAYKRRRPRKYNIIVPKIIPFHEIMDNC